jgi:hypothetical protein
MVPPGPNSAWVLIVQPGKTFKKPGSLRVFIGTNLRVVKFPGLKMEKRAGKVSGARRHGSHPQGHCRYFSHLGFKQALNGFGSLQE